MLLSWSIWGMGTWWMRLSQMAGWMRGLSWGWLRTLLIVSFIWHSLGCIMAMSSLRIYSLMSVSSLCLLTLDLWQKRTKTNLKNLPGNITLLQRSKGDNATLISLKLSHWEFWSLFFRSDSCHSNPQNILIFHIERCYKENMTYSGKI